MVNNAGIAGRAAPLPDVTDADWDTMMAVNLKSVYLCCQAALRPMLAQGSGAIVNVASIAGKEGISEHGPLLRSQRRRDRPDEGAGQGGGAARIRVNAVAPAVIETDILKQLTPDQVQYMKSRVPMGRFGRPEEAAEVIAFLASDAASFVTGQCYDVSGGRATYWSEWPLPHTLRVLRYATLCCVSSQLCSTK